MRQSLVLAVCVSFIGATELAAENEFVRPTRALAKTSTDLQIRLKIVIAEVNKGDWPEVEKILAPPVATQSVLPFSGIQPIHDSAALQGLLQNRKLLRVVSTPTLGATAGGSAYLSYETDIGVNGELPGIAVRHEFTITPQTDDPEDKSTRVQLSFNETVGEGAKQRRRTFDCPISLTTGHTFVARSLNQSNRPITVLFATADVVRP